MTDKDLVFSFLSLAAIFTLSNQHMTTPAHGKYANLKIPRAKNKYTTP